MTSYWDTSRSKVLKKWNSDSKMNFKIGIFNEIEESKVKFNRKSNE